MSDIDETIVNKFEDHYFKRVLGKYVHPELKDLHDGVEDHKEKITQIKGRCRASSSYLVGLKFFTIRQPEIDGLKWHMEQLKSSFVPEVCDQLKRYPTTVGYISFLREEHKKEIEKIKGELNVKE